MAEPGDILHSDNEPLPTSLPWGIILAGVAAVGLLIFVFWGVHQKKNEQAREAIVKVLDQELGIQEKAIKDQREKVLELSRRVEALRTGIQLGQVKGGKAAVDEFNALAAQQRTERDKFTAMAEDYNKKVAKFKELSE